MGGHPDRLRAASRGRIVSPAARVAVQARRIGPPGLRSRTEATSFTARRPPARLPATRLQAGVPLRALRRARRALARGDSALARAERPSPGRIGPSRGRNAPSPGRDGPSRGGNAPSPGAGGPSRGRTGPRQGALRPPGGGTRSRRSGAASAPLPSPGRERNPIRRASMTRPEAPASCPATCHILRHSFTTHLLMSGYHIRTLAAGVRLAVSVRQAGRADAGAS
jgi:hypothetical protein